MSSKEWKRFTFDEISKKIFSGGTPSTTNEAYWNGTFNWLSSGETRNRFIFDTIDKITQKGIDESSTRLAKKRDTVIASAGQGKTRGQVSFLEVDAYINQSIIAISPNSEIVEPLWIFYNLSNRYDELRQLSDSSSIRGSLTTQVVRQMQITLPPLPTQRRIADILSALDERIELNRQTNATLEALAQSIFREWFVAFNFPDEIDPKGLPRNQASSQAKESGKNGSRSAGQTFRVSDLPKGWRVGKLGEICEFAYGKGLKSENRIEGEFPVIGSNGIVGTHNEYLVEGPGIVIGRKGTIGEVNWVNQNFFPIDTTFYIKDLLGVNALYFHYFLLKEQDFKKIGSDSAVPGLNRNQAYDNVVMIPPLELINQFNETMLPVFENIHNNEQQSATLASAREALLPKLMSGEIEV